MREFVSEVLPSAYNSTLHADGDEFVVYSSDNDYVVLTKDDIARMYEIAFPQVVEKMKRILEYQNDPVNKLFTERMSEVLEHMATMPIACYPEAIRHVCIPAEQAKQMLDMLQHQYRVYMKTKYGDIINFDNETT